MFNTTLQERIERYAAEGRSFLDKLDDGPVTIQNAVALIRSNLKNSIYALLIEDVKELARQNGVNLRHDAKYSEAMDALRGIDSEYRAARIAGVYFLSMYFLNTPNGRENMKDGLMRDLVSGVPYAGNILVTIINLENKNSSSNLRYG